MTVSGVVMFFDFLFGQTVVLGNVWGRRVGFDGRDETRSVRHFIVLS